MLLSFKRSLRTGATGLLVSALLTGASMAAPVEITITNNQASGGLYLTPLLAILHDGSYDTFDVGVSPSAGVQLLAEEGNPAGVTSEIAALDAANGTNTQTAVLTNPAGFAGAPVLDPGEVTTIRVNLDVVSQRFFSFLSMVIPSNDAFIGNDNPTAYELFDTSGTFIFNQLIEVSVGDAWDAGTELSDGNGAAFAPPTGTPATDTDTGVLSFADLDFLIGRPQAAGGTVLSADGLLATIEIAVVPLPAGLPLLVAGLGAIGFMSSRKKRARS